MIIMSDLGDALIIHGLKARHMLLNMYVDLMMVSMTLELMETLVSFKI